TKLNQDGKLKEKRILYAGQKVKKDLALGFNPGEDPEINPYQVDMETGEFNIRGGIKWMTDYETAVKSGMAITVPLPHNAEEFKTPNFDSVFVLGVRDKTDKNIMEDSFI